VQHHGIDSVASRQHLAPGERRVLSAGGDVPGEAPRPEVSGHAEELGRPVLELYAETDHLGLQREDPGHHRVPLPRFVERHHRHLVPGLLGDRSDHADAEVLLHISSHQSNQHGTLLRDSCTMMPQE
jgi:hypothetical protein